MADFDHLITFCRPRDPADYPPARYQLWLQGIEAMEAEGQASPPIYPGSVFVPCETCKITVAVGPRTQEALLVNRELKVRCMLCAIELMGNDTDTEVTVMELGNPFKKATS